MKVLTFEQCFCNGLGTHIVYLRPEQITIYLKVRWNDSLVFAGAILQSMQTIMKDVLTFPQTLFTGSILYTCCIGCIKLSNLMLYRPVESMDIVVWIVSAIVV